MLTTLSQPCCGFELIRLMHCTTSQVESQRRYYEQQDSARAAAPPAKAESKSAGADDPEALRGRVTELQVGTMPYQANCSSSNSTSSFC